jgi:hypothetical protein
MRTTDPGDAARIELLLAELRLPAIKQLWASLAAQAADKEGWPAGRFLTALADTGLPSAVAVAWNAISPKPGCRPAEPSTPSTRGRPGNQQSPSHSARCR